jgi:hypothetical protein
MALHKRVNRLFIWVAVFAALNAADLGTTLIALARGAYEASPVPAAILAHLGLAGFVAAKVAVVGIMCANLVYAHRRYPKHAWLAVREAQVYCAFVAVIVASNVWVIARAGS